MKITEHTPTHYFTKNKSKENFHSMMLEAYLEIPQGDGTSSFRQVEGIRLFISTDMEDSESISFHYDGGRNAVMHHWANNLHELQEQQESDASIYGFKMTTKEKYLSLREKAFEVYLNYQMTDFNRLEIGSEFKL